MDVPMNDAARSARRQEQSGRRAARERGTSISSATNEDHVDAETALLALEKLEVEMKSLIRRASAMSNVKNRNRVDNSDEDDTRVRMEMLEKIHLLASMIATFVSSPHARSDACEEGKASTARATRSRKRRVRESIRNVESLIKEAEDKLERWEKMLIEMYKQAENVCAPPPQQRQQQEGG